jgi:hypothetical protein
MRSKADLGPIEDLLANWVRHSYRDSEELKALAQRAMESGNIEVASGLGAAIIGIEAATDNLQATLEKVTH